jgi:hypothetical protein
VAVAQQLGLPVTSEEDDVREELRNRDKYIDMYAAGYAVRSDWSDGPDAVVRALGRFEELTPEDKAIAREWQDICADFEDGRSFRDAVWSYDRVLELADPSLVSLWNSLSE